MTKDFLTGISGISGGSGYESGAAGYIKKEFEKYSTDVTIDGHYNVTARKTQCGCKWVVPKVLICAHMDEVSLMVKSVDENGFIKVVTNGGMDTRLFPGLEVIVHGKRDVRGVFGSKPPHIQKPDEANKSISLEDMYIDTGLENAADVISIGDIITYDSPMTELGSTYIMGKAMDDRAGVAIMLAAIRELEKLRYNADVYFAATVQEELGTKGATMVANRIAPDIGIAIDVTHGCTPDAGVSTGNTVPMDKGISITVGPNIHEKLCEKLISVAEENNIDYVIEANPRPTGTDARALQVSGAGVPSLLLSIPLRYMHTPCEVINPKTVDTAGKLLALFIASLGEDWKQWTSY